MKRLRDYYWLWFWGSTLAAVIMLVGYSLQTTTSTPTYKEILLSIGGTHVNNRSLCDVNDSYLFYYPVQYVDGGTMNECVLNSERWIMKHGNGSLCMGYVLCGSYWVEHAWVFNGTNIIEPSPVGNTTKYYGRVIELWE